MLGFTVFKKVHITSLASCFELLKSRIRLVAQFFRIVPDDPAMPPKLKVRPPLHYKISFQTPVTRVEMFSDLIGDMIGGARQLQNQILNEYHVMIEFPEKLLI